MKETDLFIKISLNFNNQSNRS